MSPKAVPRPHRPPRPVRLLVLSIPLLALPLTGGCVGLSLAAIGTALDAAGSAVGTGREVFSLGKLNTVQMASVSQTVDATRQAAQDLRLSGKKESREDDQTAHLEFADDKCSSIKVRIEPRTRNLVRIRIDVGIFGSEPTARLFLARLRAHLPGGASPVPKTDES